MFEGPVQNLIDELAQLPGVGPKGAARIAFYVMQRPKEDVYRLAEAFTEVAEKVQFCAICFNISEAEICRICQDPRRDNQIICVVEEPKDIVAIEKTHEFRGRYHVLGGAIDPMRNIGAQDLHIKELMQRLNDPEISEIILALNPTVEGDATATYLTRFLADIPNINVSRPASGLPVGADLEYADEVTLGRAFSGRRKIN